MDLKQIERLMAVMGRTGIKRVSLKQEGFEIELERETMGAPSSTVFYAPQASLPQTQGGFFPTESSGKPATDKDEGSKYITSPMVGTFYSSPSPDDPAYLKVGDEVEEQSVVCIIEAMKVMNEVKASLKGKVVEILVKNGDPVEFGTKLMRVI